MMGHIEGMITQDLHRWASVLFVCFVIICVASLLDLWTGIDAARANGEKVRSRPLRRTGVKIGDYFRLVLFFLLIDALGICFPWYAMPYAVIAATAGVLAVEGFSVVENFQRKKSHAADVADIAGRIVECMTPEDARRIIELIKDKGKHEDKA